MTLTVAGMEATVIFVEQRDRKFKVSFRSRSSVDCSRAAEQFGGGGHKAAAGATLDAGNGRFLRKCDARVAFGLNARNR